MVDQTKVKGHSNGRGESIPLLAARNLAALLHDLVSLSELQMRLLALDARQAVRGVVGPLVLIAAGVVLAMCSIPMILAAVAFVLIETAHLSHAAAFAWTFLGGLVVAVLLVSGAIGWLRSRPDLFECSRRECAQNVQWLKDMLRRASRSSREDPSETWRRSGRADELESRR